MFRELLPSSISSMFNNINTKYITEIRIRAGQPVVVAISGKNYYLGKYGISQSKQNAYIASIKDCDYVISKSCNDSFYSINDQIINGYISYKGGVRIGVAGEFVYVDNKLKTIKNINSLNIRIPHEVENCALSSFRFLHNSNSIYNTLVLSPAGCGKTTFIRDVIKQIMKNNDLLNLLVVDERSEITGVRQGVVDFKNMNVDVLSNCTKQYAFDNGIRSLSPDVIVTDELSINDVEIIENAITCGVKVIATIHADSILDLKNKIQFQNILSKKMFDRFVVLNDSNGPGTLVGIYNENLECLAL